MSLQICKKGHSISFWDPDNPLRGCLWMAMLCCLGCLWPSTFRLYLAWLFRSQLGLSKQRSGLFMAVYFALASRLPHQVPVRSIQVALRAVYGRLLYACISLGSSGPIWIESNANFGTAHAVHRSDPVHPLVTVNPHPDPADGSAVHRAQLPLPRKGPPVQGERPS